MAGDNRGDVIQDNINEGTAAAVNDDGNDERVRTDFSFPDDLDEAEDTELYAFEGPPSSLEALPVEVKEDDSDQDRCETGDSCVKWTQCESQRGQFNGMCSSDVTFKVCCRVSSPSVNDLTGGATALANADKGHSEKVS